MKILMLNSEYPPLGGGQGNANKYTYTKLQKYENLEIDIITASVNDKKIETSNLGNIYYLNIGKKDKNLHFQSIKDLITYSIKALLFSFKLSKKYDVIVAWGGVPPGFLAYAIHLFKKTPYIVLLRGTDVPFFEDRWYWLDKLILSWLSPITWKSAANVYANSNGLKQLAQNFLPNKEIGVIYNGVDTEYFYPATQPKLLANKIIILSVGRLVERKNYAMLLKTVAKIPENSKIEIQIAGEGPERENLVQLAKNLKVNLKLYGEKFKTELVKIYQQADIFVLPSKNEGMSNSVLEAMACGLPCIVSDVGGSSEMIENNGFVLQKNDEEHLQLKIEYFIKNPEQIELMGNNSRKKAETLSWDVVTNNLFKIFTQSLTK